MMNKLLAILSVVMLLTACDNEPLDPVIQVDQGGDDEVSEEGSFSADVDGEEFVLQALTTATSQSEDDPIITIAAVDEDMNTITINFPESVGEGTVDFSNNMNQVMLSYGSAGVNYMAVSGELEITSLDTTAKTVAGDFDATFEDVTDTEPSIEINGEFDVSY